MKESGMGNPVRPPGPRLQALLDEGLREVTVEADYFADPLWARNSGGPIGNLELNSFGIQPAACRRSTELGQRMGDRDSGRSHSAGFTGSV